MPPYEMLYGRRCRMPVYWDEVGSRELASTYVVLATTKNIETIPERLKATEDRWKSYANNRRRLIELNVVEFVMLKVSPWKGVFRFKNKGKLSLRAYDPLTRSLRTVQSLCRKLQSYAVNSQQDYVTPLKEGLFSLPVQTPPSPVGTPTSPDCFPESPTVSPIVPSL
ncbi:hypothetical protein Tco_0741529 [Tanacetum coccineum]